MKRVALVLAVVSVACSPEVLTETDPGTSVGNPTKTRTRVALHLAPAKGFMHTTFLYPLRDAELNSCSGFEDRWEIADDIDLLGAQVLVDPPLGAWCTQTYPSSGNVVIEGDYKSTPYRFEIERPTIEMEGTWTVVGEDAYILELGSLDFLQWFTPALAGGHAIDVGVDHPSQEAIRATFERGAALYLDRDGDGKLSDEERDRWQLAKGT